MYNRRPVSREGFVVRGKESRELGREEMGGGGGQAGSSSLSSPLRR